MSNVVKRWTVIRCSGKADIFDGVATPNSKKYTYLEVLEWCYNDMMSGGSQYDRPNMLLADGVVIIDKDLHDMAYAYGIDLRDAYAAARAVVTEKHKMRNIKNGQE